jgi:hypothetical protein
MKKLLPILFLLIFQNGFSQVYNKMLGNTNTWNYAQNAFGVFAPPHSENAVMVMSANSVYLQGENELFADFDSLINGQEYKALTNDLFGSFVYGFIREDSALKQVFFLPENDSVEVLLYNFSLAPGDSTFITFPNSTCGFTTGWYKLDSIVNKPIFAGNRRHFYLSNSLNTPNSGSNKMEPLIWIESAGNPIHLLYPFLSECGNYGPLTPDCDIYEFTFMLCKYTDSARIYFNSCAFNSAFNGSSACCIVVADSCHLYSAGGIHEHDLFSKISLYPMPVIDELSIKFEADNSGELQLNICEITGRIVPWVCQSIGYNVGSNEISLSAKNLNRGFYFLIMENEKKKIVMKKFIITR